MPATHCTGCGKRLARAPDPSTAADAPAAARHPGHMAGDAPATDRCPGCARPIDPPRYCPTCGGWLAVTVTPTGWTARCRVHGDLAPGGTNG